MVIAGTRKGEYQVASSKNLSTVGILKSGYWCREKNEQNRYFNNRSTAKGNDARKTAGNCQVSYITGHMLQNSIIQCKVTCWFLWCLEWVICSRWPDHHKPVTNILKESLNTEINNFFVIEIARTIQLYYSEASMALKIIDHGTKATNKWIECVWTYCASPRPKLYPRWTGKERKEEVLIGFEDERRSAGLHAYKQADNSVRHRQMAVMNTRVQGRALAITLMNFAEI